MSKKDYTTIVRAGRYPIINVYPHFILQRTDNDLYEGVIVDFPYDPTYQNHWVALSSEAQMWLKTADGIWWAKGQQEDYAKVGIPTRIIKISFAGDKLTEVK